MLVDNKVKLLKQLFVPGSWTYAILRSRNLSLGEKLAYGLVIPPYELLVKAGMYTVIYAAMYTGFDGVRRII